MPPWFLGGDFGLNEKQNFRKLIGKQVLKIRLLDLLHVHQQRLLVVLPLHRKLAGVGELIAGQLHRHLEAVGVQVAEVVHTCGGGGGGVK